MEPSGLFLLQWCLRRCCPCFLRVFLVRGLPPRLSWTPEAFPWGVSSQAQSTFQHHSCVPQFTKAASHVDTGDPWRRRPSAYLKVEARRCSRRIARFEAQNPRHPLAKPRVPGPYPEQDLYSRNPFISTSRSRLCPEPLNFVSAVRELQSLQLPLLCSCNLLGHPSPSSEASRDLQAIGLSTEGGNQVSK